MPKANDASCSKPSAPECQHLLTDWKCVQADEENQRPGDPEDQPAGLEPVRQWLMQASGNGHPNNPPGSVDMISAAVPSDAYSNQADLPDFLLPDEVSCYTGLMSIGQYR